MDRKNYSDLSKAIEKFNSVKILVIGDVMLDEYIKGKTNRISPEAPVVVVQVEEKEYVPGGAANVAKNIRDLGAKVYLTGVIGKDNKGILLKEKLKGNSIPIIGIKEDSLRPTTTKTRIIAHHQQIVRIDEEKTEEIQEKTIKELITFIVKKINGIDGVIMSDYAKGCLNRKFLKRIIPIILQRKKLIVVDSKADSFKPYFGVAAIICNEKEARAVCGGEIVKEKSISELGRILLKGINCQALLITLGEKGIAVFQKRKKPVYIPAIAQEVYDVTGAGDTVTSVFTLGVVSGLNFVDASYLANIAAGEVIKKVGASTVTQLELHRSLERNFYGKTKVFISNKKNS